MASGEVVRLCFDKNSVKAERSYKVKDRAEQVYLIAFVYFYGRKTDIKIERSVTDMLGELRLHNALYVVGYKRKNTADAGHRSINIKNIRSKKSLKERNFKFRKSYAEVIRVMDDKQAGRFIKAVSDYVFDGRAYDGNDTAIKSAFTLVKVSLDGDKADRENGRRGGVKSRELRKAKEEQPCVAKVIASGIVASEMLKSILEGRETPSDDEGETTENCFGREDF